MLTAVASLVPKLEHSLHKGSCGSIGVLGGCFEYTGAPYYAAISTLKAGADLAHVFCAREAATPIKSYSPELIVHPVFVTSQQAAADVGVARAAVVDKAVKAVCDWFPRLSALVVGPGLGRDELMLECVAQVVERARAAGLPVVLDGDGAFLLCQRPAILAGYQNGVVTPNVREFARLQAALGLSEGAGGNETVALARALGGVTVLRKGATDEISNGTFLAKVALQSTIATAPPRRCGGQGDVLAGTTGVFLSWAAKAGRLEENVTAAPPPPPVAAAAAAAAAAVEVIDLMCPDAAAVDRFTASPGAAVMLAALGGSIATRAAAASAFAQHKRSMTTPDLISHMGGAFEQLFPTAAL